MKNRAFTVALLTFFITVSACSRVEVKIAVSELKCENLTNPNAIDNTKPHFSWKIKSERPMQQRAYEIQVASDSALLQNGSADLWHSGKVKAASSVMVPYNGAGLSARSLCYWRVRVWNEKGEVSAWAPIARFGVGLLSKNDMQGSFIGLAGVKSPILRKKFTVAGRNTSFLHVNSLGYHEVYLNGEKVSKDVLSPAVSQLNKHSMVVTYDVTSHLQPGENELVIWLGQGWYKQSAWDRVDIMILDGPVVRAQLDVRQNKEWNTVLITDSSWQGRASGYEDTGSWNALRFGGENVQAAGNPENLYPATLDKLTWQPAIVRTAHDHEIIPEMTEPNRIQEKIPAKSITKIDAATWLVDMGKSVNGWFEWRVPSLPKGQKISIHYSDDINADGTWLDMTGGQSDQYTVSGEKGEVFCNKFNHHAFRYVKICNTRIKPGLEDMNAYLIHTDYKAAASFACSDSDLNAIHDMIQYTMRCLAFAGYMVDCPHLERAGYGGDGNSSLLSLQTMYDAAPLFANWLQAWADAMREEGSLPHVAPNPGAGGGGPYWCGFIIMAPWQTYVNYNDSRLIEKYYPAMKKWLGYVDKYTVNGLLKRWPDLPYRDWYLGDWLAPDGVDAGNQSSIDLVNNCFISDCLDKMEKIATLLGKPDEAAGFAARRNALNQLLHDTYFHSSTKSYATGSQLDMAYPMLVGVTPNKVYASVQQQLFNYTDKNHSGHIAAGLVGVPIVTRWAIENKAADFMYAMLKKRTYPGYLYMIDNGATTTWESWNRERSRIHNCYNGIGSWFYQAIGGIRPDEANPGYRHVFIDPQIPQGVTWAKTTKESPYGTIAVDWVLESQNRLKVNITLPVGTQGTFVIPGKAQSCKVDGLETADLSRHIALENGAHEIVVLLPATVQPPVHPQSKNPVTYVNTLQGTDSHFGLSYGNTYPTLALPFGQHFWSAQTGKNGDGWKYQYAATAIRGFQQTHQCSPWVGDYGVFSLMPVAGDLRVEEEQRAATFSHANETALPHDYRVKFDNGLSVEIAPTERTAHFRFSFPENQAAYVVLDGYTKNSRVTIDPQKRQITGYVDNGNFVPANFKAHFVVQFDKPFETFGTWENVNLSVKGQNLSAEGKGAGAYIGFEKGATVEARVTSSYISIEQAQITLNRELGKFKKIEDTRAHGQKTWNDLLHRVSVEGGTEEQQRTFYSCLFRANLFSRKFYELDKNGKPYYFSPYDGKIHKGYMFTDNGFWDTFRSQFPLTNILHPAMQGQYMNALLDAQEQCGWFPAWSAPGETGGMLGNHAISLLADAWAKGIRTFDPKRALKAYLHEATNKGPWGGANGRPCWKEYYQLGYIPYPESSGSTAQTLESAYDDWCAYQLAKMTGHDFYAGVFERQMYNYRNVYDPNYGFMRGRHADGSWVEFDPFEWGGPYCEGNAWHYNWSVFHDVQGLIDLMGGDEKFTAKIDSVFTLPNTVKYGTYGMKIHEMLEMELAGMGQYAQGNQPIQHLIYLYNYAGQPWKTQYRIRQVMDRLYNATEKGFPGDEDQGGMSSWYVLSALGIYSVCPGTDEYVLGSPLFPKATITMESGKQFTIEAVNNSLENVYIQSATLNGNPLTKNHIRYSDIANGGVLRLEMGNQPNRTRGIDKSDCPFSLSLHEL